MKILLDTNIVLDLLLEREQFFDAAKNIFLLVEEKKIRGFLSASSITTIHYLVNKSLSKDEANKVIEMLLILFEIAPLNKNIFVNALENIGVDFEDSVIHSCAFSSKVDYIVTRDKKGFKTSKVSILTPMEFLGFYESIC